MSKDEKLVNLELGQVKDGKRVPFDELAVGHTFTLTGAGRMPEGENFWCAFCGGRGKNFYDVRRDDGCKLKVGERCLGLVGLAKRDLPKPKPKTQARKVVTVKKEEMPDSEFSVEALDKLLEGL